MTGTSSAGEHATQLFNSGYNCAESVALALAEHLNVHSDALPRAATPFGGGISRNGMLCGALAGGCIVIGLLEGRHDASELRDPSYSETNHLLADFAERFAFHDCRTLTGVDFNDPRSAERYKQIHHEKCVHYVRFVADLLARRLDGRSSPGAGSAGAGE